MLDKHEQLGINYNTAMARLRTIIMFDLVKQLNKNTCYRCNEIIKSIDEFSIDHKEPWLHNNIELFWNLDNIAFAHKKCNYKAARRVKRVQHEGKFICPTCSKSKLRSEFYSSNDKLDKIHSSCKKCMNLRNKLYKRRRKFLGNMPK